jgi:hypothetical protein
VKRIVTSIVGLLVGVAIGWYFAHTHPDAKRGRELLKEYEQMRALGTDADLAKIGNLFKNAETINSLGRTDELAALLAVSTVTRIDRGDIGTAKTNLAVTVQRYYLTYRNNGADTNLILHIEKVAQESPYLADLLAKKPE